MHRCVHIAFAAAVSTIAGSIAFPAKAQMQNPRADELDRISLFSEVVQVSAPGRARDVSFEATGFDVITANDIVWISDPTTSGVVAVASRPILDTAKAGETLGARGNEALPSTVALAVSKRATFALQESGQLVIVRSGWSDSVLVGSTVVGSVDVAIGNTDLIYVLWGKIVHVYADPPESPLWSFEIAPELLPAAAISVSTRGEVYVAGRGEVALAVYDVGEDGEFTEIRSVTREDLDLASVTGMTLTPKMLLPSPGREGWVEQDRFVLLGDGEAGTFLFLDAGTFQTVGSWSVREELPFSSPGRIAISNRGQIAFVDQRSQEAYCLPTRITVAMLEKAKFRWRNLTPTIRVQGGGQPPPPPDDGHGHNEKDPED